MAEFYVKVTPDSESFDIEYGTITKVFLTRSAENGRANAELVSELTDILGVKPAIISGHKSRRKKMKVNLPEEKLKEKLNEVS